MSEIVGLIANLSAFTFIITSMLAMGLSLTVWQVTAVAAQPASDELPVRADP